MRPFPNAEQRWFVGAHANVGGGCFNDLLPQAPLSWMMRKASSLGLTFHEAIEFGRRRVAGKDFTLIRGISKRVLQRTVRQILQAY